VTRPKVLFVGRTRYRFPLSPSLQRKFDALQEVIDLRVLASGEERSASANGTFVLHRPVRPRVLDGPAFYALLPLRVARHLRAFRPDAVVAQTVYEGAAVLAARAATRTRARLVLEIHADWRTSTRLYGSTARRVFAPLGDTVARRVLRRADAVRTIGAYTTELVRRLGVEPAAVFPAFMDLAPFTARPPAPLPDRPQALFVGVLELYKNVDGLADAWRLAAPHLAGATLHVVGRGSRADVAERLVRDLPESTRWSPRLSTEEIAAALDESTVLVLPSRSEGMGRVIVEAFFRGRPVVGARVGGIPDLVREGENGLLIEPGDTQALADALVLVLTDRALAEQLAEGARRRAFKWMQSPELFADRMRALVEDPAVEFGRSSL
jgi:glycosyltransferase involved in cell wall biosynthesis